MTDKEFQQEVIKHMASTNTELKNLNGWMSKIDGKVETMQTDGCAKGGENDRRLKRLEDAPKKATAGGAFAGGVIASVVIAAVEVFQFFMSKK